MRYFEQHGLSNPSYDTKYRAPETSEFDALLTKLNEVTYDSLRLINGPKKSMASLLQAHYDLAAYQVALEFGFFEAVPIGAGESIHLKDLAKKVNIDENRVGRIMKFLSTQGVFEEVDIDVFQHMSHSAIFTTNAEVKALGLMP